MRRKILSFVIIMVLLVSIIPIYQNMITNSESQSLEGLFGSNEIFDLLDLNNDGIIDISEVLIYNSSIKADIEEDQGTFEELLFRRDQNSRHWWNDEQETFRYQSDQLVYKENVSLATNWLLESEYPITYIIRLNNGSLYSFDTPTEISNFFTQIDNSTIWGLAVESFAGAFGFFMNFTNPLAQGQYLFYPRLSNGRLSGYNMPLYAIYTHLYTRIGATIYDAILMNQSLYEAQHNPKNNLHFINTADTLGFYFNTNDITILNTNWNIRHGLKYNSTDGLFHLITELQCTSMGFDDIGVAYEIASSPQSDGTPYQPSEFRISNDTHQISADVSQVWEAGTYLQDFYSKIEIISENSEGFTFSFADMENAGFTEKYLDLHNQNIPAIGVRKILRAGMYGYGSYLQNDWINIDPTFSAKQTADEQDFWVQLEKDSTFQFRDSDNEIRFGTYNWSTHWDRRGYISFDLGISDGVSSIDNVVLTFYASDIDTETDEYAQFGLYYNSTLDQGFWNETYGSGKEGTLWNQTTYYSDPSFWTLEGGDTGQNNTAPSVNATALMEAWRVHHNLDPTNREHINFKLQNGTNQDPLETDKWDLYESSRSTVSQRPSLSFDYYMDIPVIVEVKNGTWGNVAEDTSTTVGLSQNITGTANYLYLAAISSKSYRDTTSVTGLNLTWIELEDQTSGRGNTGTSVWYAVANSTVFSEGNVTATIAEAQKAIALQVIRIANADLSDPIGITESSNTNGENGGGSGGSDDEFPTLDMVIEENQSLVLGFVARRSHPIQTAGAGYTILMQLQTNTSSGGTDAGLDSEYARANSTGNMVVNCTLDGDSDWALIGIEVRPAIIPPVIPEIDSPANQTLDYGFTNENITWTPTEREFPNDSYVVYRNGSIFDSGNWINQTPIVITLDSINTTIGIHNFSIMINDTNNNQATDTVWITVNPPDIPEIDSPANQTLDYGFTDENITWTPTERYYSPDSYVVYRNGSIFDSGSWTNQTPIVITLDSINTTFGNHNFTIVINDTNANQASDLVWITVNPPDFPEIDSPANQTLEAGFSDENITWTPTERTISSDTYTVYRNGSIFDSGSWINQTPIVIDIDSINLILGIHNFTIVINDTSNNQALDIVWITVQDTTNPVLNSPADITYEFGDIGLSNEITWNATDLLPNSYTVYKNDSINETGSWLSGVLIVISVDGLAVGSWNFTIWVNDTYGNNAFDTVFVFVTVAINDPPVFIAWFESSDNVLPDTDVLFYVNIYDCDNTSSELNITLYYSFIGFSYQNLSVNLTYVSTVASCTYRFEYTFSGQEAGTDLIFYYVGFDGEFYVYKQDLINLEWQEDAITIIRLPQPDRISHVFPEPDILRIAILVIVVITLFAMILILMAKSRKGKPIKVIRTEVEYIYE